MKKETPPHLVIPTASDDELQRMLERYRRWRIPKMAAFVIPSLGALMTLTYFGVPDSDAELRGMLPIGCAILMALVGVTMGLRNMMDGQQADKVRKQMDKRAKQRAKRESASPAQP